MKSKKEISKIAKKLFQASFTAGKLNRTKIRENIRLIKENYKNLSIWILKAYLTLIKQQVAGETLLIETPDYLNHGYIDKIKNLFEKKTGKTLQITLKRNPAILGGLKITLADNQWDFSVKGKIVKIKEILLHG